MLLLDCVATSCPLGCGLAPMQILQIFSTAFLAILFLQSGLDKVFDWKGNLEWLTGHFSNSPLKGMVPLLLGVITLVETAAGAFSAIGAGTLFLGGSVCFGFIGATLSAVALLMLFLGQRLAKDYAGAGGLVPYFILTLITMYLLVA